jgi:hypothetical protein
LAGLQVKDSVLRVTIFPLFPPQKTGTTAGVAAAQLLHDLCVKVFSFTIKVTSGVHLSFPSPILSHHIPFQNPGYFCLYQELEESC